MATTAKRLQPAVPKKGRTIGLDMVRHHSQSRRDKARPEVKAMEQVEDHALRVELKDPLPGTVHSGREGRASRPSSLKVELHHSSNRSKLQPERSMNNGSNSLGRQPRSRHISPSIGGESSTTPYWTPDVNGPSWASVCFRRGWSCHRQPMTCTPLIVLKFR